MIDTLAFPSVQIEFFDRVKYNYQFRFGKYKETGYSELFYWKVILKRVILMRKIYLVVLLIVVVMYLPINISAYQCNGHKLSGGVGSYGSNKRYYYIDSTCTGGMSDYINTAWQEWTYTTSSINPVGIETSISVKNTTTKSQSSFDFYYTYIYPAEYKIYAKTFFYVSNTLATVDNGMLIEAVQMPNVDWTWTEIKINSASYGDLATSNVHGINPRKGTIAHEIGHAMGLWHVGDEDKLMSLGGSELVDKCTADELRGINSLY